MDILIPKTKSHAVDCVYDKFTKVEQFVFNYILKSFPEFMYYYKENDGWIYNEPLLSMIAILAKAIGSSRELILNLDTSKDINSLYSKIKNNIYTNNNKKLLYALATELQYDIGNLDTDIDSVISKLEKEEPFVKNNLVGVRNRGTIEAIKELLMQYSRFEEEYNVQYYAEDAVEPFKVNIGVNLTDFSNNHPLYRALMNIRPAGIVFNILDFIRRLIAYNTGAGNAVVRQLSYVNNLVGPPRPLSTETRRAPELETSIDVDILNYTITHSNPQSTLVHITLYWDYGSTLSFLNYTESEVVTMQGSIDGITDITSNRFSQNRHAAEATVSISAYATDVSDLLQSSTVSKTGLPVGSPSIPANPIAPVVTLISTNNIDKTVTLDVQNVDTRIIPTMRVLYYVRSLGTGWVIEETLSTMTQGEIREVTLQNMPTGHIINLKAIAMLTATRTTESNIVNAYMEHPEITPAPSVILVSCISEGGNNRITANIKNNATTTAEIVVNGNSIGNVSGNTEVDHIIATNENIPYSYSVSVTAKEPSKVISAVTTKTGKVTFCLTV